MAGITESAGPFDSDTVTDDEYQELLGDDRRVERLWGDDDEYDWG